MKSTSKMSIGSDEIFDEIPHKSSPRTLYIIIITVVFLGIAAFLTSFFWPKTVEQNDISNIADTADEETTASPANSSKDATDKSNSTPAPKTTTQNSATANSADIYQVPAGETYIKSSIADTNGDKKKETLVVTKNKLKKYHAYVLTVDGKKIFDNAELLQAPVRIDLISFNQGESYKTWMLVFTEDSGNLAYIHWNGTKYEIPENIGI